MIVELHHPVKFRTEKGQPDSVLGLQALGAGLSQGGLHGVLVDFGLGHFVQHVETSHSFFYREESEEGAGHRVVS